MEDTNLLALISVILVSSISLLGAFTLVLKSKFIKGITFLLVSLAAGTLVGDVFIHIIPELYEEASSEIKFEYIILFGIIFFFILEKILHWRHNHFEHSEKYFHPIAINNLLADGIHNFVDGLIIAAAFQISVPVGVATTIAVILHEIPQEIGDFGILIHSGIKPKIALMFNFLSAILAILGTLFGILLGETSENFEQILIAFAAGGFLYIAIADLIPEIKHENNYKKSILQAIIFIIGIIIMFGLTYLE